MLFTLFHSIVCVRRRGHVWQTIYLWESFLGLKLFLVCLPAKSSESTNKTRREYFLLSYPIVNQRHVHLRFGVVSRAPSKQSEKTAGANVPCIGGASNVVRCLISVFVCSHSLLSASTADCGASVLRKYYGGDRVARTPYTHECKQ